MENKIGYYITIRINSSHCNTFYFRNFTFGFPQFENARLSSCIFESLEDAVGKYNELCSLYENNREKDLIEIKLNEHFIKSLNGK
jgi:hypothetical protein